MLAKILALVASFGSCVNAIDFQDIDSIESNSVSYYESPVKTMRESDYSYGPSPLQLYYDYYYHEYYGGQTVAAIIFLDILLPIVCCVIIIWVIVCIVRAARRNAQHQHGHQPGHHHGTHSATITTTYYQTGAPMVYDNSQGGNPYAMQQPMQ